MISINKFLGRCWALYGLICFIKQFVHHEAMNALLYADFNYLFIVDAVLNTSHEIHNVFTDSIVF